MSEPGAVSSHGVSLAASSPTQGARDAGHLLRDLEQGHPVKSRADSQSIKMWDDKCLLFQAPELCGDVLHSKKSQHGTWKQKMRCR